MELFKKDEIKPDSNNTPQLCEDIGILVCEDTSSDKLIELFRQDTDDCLPTTKILEEFFQSEKNDYNIENEMSRESIFSEDIILTKKDGKNCHFYYIPEGQQYFCIVRYIRKLKPESEEKYEIGYSYRMTNKNLIFDPSIHTIKLTKSKITDKIQISKLDVNDTKLPSEFERFAFNVEHFSNSTPLLESKVDKLTHFCYQCLPQLLELNNSN